MQNYDIARNTLNTSLFESEGSADEELKKYQEGVAYSLDLFKAQFQEFSNTLISSDFFKGIVDSGTAFLNVLTQIIDKVGLLPPLLATIGATSFIKNFG